MRKLHFPALTPQNSEALRLTVLQSTFWASMAIGGYQTVYLQNNGFPAAQRRGPHDALPPHAHRPENALMWWRIIARSGEIATMDTMSKRTGTSTTSKPCRNSAAMRS